MNSLKVLSYNIHKGFSLMNRKFVLKKIKESIDYVQADVVFLQEVVGHHERHGLRIREWPQTSQFEFLADRVWPHFAYGKNAVYAEGHHGNAILSKYPISFFENIDVSTNSWERRGLLHAVVQKPGEGIPIHLICVHFDLFEKGRLQQIEKLAERVRRHVPPSEALLIAGDFNDWRERATKILKEKLQVEEAFYLAKGAHAQTFPSWFPVFCLDRIYFRGFHLAKAEVWSSGLWLELSDHAAISAEFIPVNQKNWVGSEDERRN